MVESVLVMLSPAFCDFGWCVAQAAVCTNELIVSKHLHENLYTTQEYTNELQLLQVFFAYVAKMYIVSLFQNRKHSIRAANENSSTF